MQKALYLIIALATMTPISGADKTSAKSKHKTPHPTNHLAGMFTLLKAHVFTKKAVAFEEASKIQGMIDIFDPLPLSSTDKQTLTSLKERLKRCTIRSKATWSHNPPPTAEKPLLDTIEFPLLGDKQRDMEEAAHLEALSKKLLPRPSSPQSDQATPNLSPTTTDKADSEAEEWDFVEVDKEML
jgi:hypothetical protein